MKTDSKRPATSYHMAPDSRRPPGLRFVKSAQGHPASGSFADLSLLPILWAVIVCTLPHFINVAWWVVFACLFLWTYIALAARYVWPLPGKTFSRMLAGLFFVGAMTTHEGFTIEAFVALLSLMVALKLFELRSDHDRKQTVILCYFLIVGGLFFGDTIEATLYKFFSIIFTTAVLIHLNRPGRGGPSPLKLALLLIGQALPIMVVLFLFFPRIQGGLWGRTHANSARAGFSEEINFGSLTDLAKNNEAAFRVEFAGDMPLQKFLYWRGVVLWDFDGKTWRRGLSHHTTPAKRIKGEQPVNYIITLEPHNKRWLFSLDLPRKIDLPITWLLNDYSYYSWQPVNRRLTYSGLSYLDGVDDSLPAFTTEIALRLPAGANPRSRELAESLRRESSSETDFIGLTLAYFKAQNFLYTLNPPILTTAADDLDQSQIDRFIFESRQGFCEHFAGSFVFLMRAAGLPARMVVGYQGGKRNPYGEYLVVRQSDAHAWCEVWVTDQGWQRIDPTGEVAPERLLANPAQALPAGETGRFLFLPDLGVFGEWLGPVRNYWDYLNSRWNRLVIGYSFNEQTGLFSRFGFSFAGWQGFGTALFTAVAGAVLLVVLLGFFMHRPPASVRDEVAEAWVIFGRKLAAIDLPRRPGQGPIDFQEYVLRQRPDLAGSVTEIVAAYVRLRYAATGGSSSDRSILRAMVKKFSPAKQEAV
ncbi:MAG: DUF3488 and transglutaminase-like domain-containing protein [Proteobacteria bacterium]|nr:DUF3488 and transglutaminase-like domain-containing protein [Pseudomonadota bacterium]MBU1717030.1 DUF3488 and transglutaminase-like domain-containing protein [Pseudomonadota bacterium]